MKKLFLTLIAAGTFLIVPSVSQAQTASLNDSQNGTELIQLTEQLNRVAVNLGQVAIVLDAHSNKIVNSKDSKLSRKIDELHDSLIKATQKIEKIKADRNIHSVPETEDEINLLDTV